MPNLYVFDKDGTLVHPRKDGYVESPEDQILYEGVREKLDRLRSEGHALVIASNQGGCDFTAIPCYCLKPGHLFKLCPPGFGYDFDMIFKVLSTTIKDDLIDIETENATFTTFKKDVNMVKVQHKTIEGAIAEMQFAADLCGIEDAIFCPAMDGHNAIAMMKSHSEWFSDEVDSTVLERCGNFRKPGMGMLKFAEIYLSSGVQYDSGIMIGDRDSDRESAIAAGFEFVWAEDWRNG